MRIWLISVLLLILCASVARGVAGHRKHVPKAKPHAHRRKWEMFLQCPTPPKLKEKFHINVSWYLNDSVILSFTNGNVGLNRSITSFFNVSKWKTWAGDNAATVRYGERVRFEYDEQRRRYCMRMSGRRSQECGKWRCQIIVKLLPTGEILRYESRRSAYPKQDDKYAVLEVSTHVQNVIDFQENRTKPDDSDKREPSDSDERSTKNSEGNTRPVKREQPLNNDLVMFTKPSADLTVFQRMSKFHELAYIRNHDITDRDDTPTQTGTTVYNEKLFTRYNYSSVHAKPAKRTSYSPIYGLDPVLILVAVVFRIF